MGYLVASDAEFLSAVEDGTFRGGVLNLSNVKYHSLKKYWSSTALKYLKSTSPEHFFAKYILDSEPVKQTQAMLLGSLVHSLILTPDEFDKEYFVMPDLDLRTKIDKERKAQLVSANPGKIPVEQEMYDKARAMFDSASKNPQITELIGPAQKELSYFWECPFSGLNFRAKIDALGPMGMVELKTAQDASLEGFQRQVFNMNYDLSLVHYQKGIHAYRGFGGLIPAYFVVIESEAPYVTQVYKASDVLMELGHDKWLEAVSKLETGVKQKEWPGYYAKDEVIEIFPPAWAMPKALVESVEDDDIF